MTFEHKPTISTQKAEELFKKLTISGLTSPEKEMILEYTDKLAKIIIAAYIKSKNDRF